jgi:hypothetical protein
MELLHEMAWDGKSDFDVWKKELLTALTDKLRSRFSGFGETLALGPINLQVRRGRTWGFDISLSPKKDAPGVAQIKLEYGCRLIDAAVAPGLVLALPVILAVAYYWVRHLMRMSTSIIYPDLALGVIAPLLSGFVVFGLWIAGVSQLAKLLGKPPDHGEYERLMAEIREFVRQRGLDLPEGFVPAVVKIVRKNIKPKMGEEIVFDTALTEQEWIKRIHDQHAKNSYLLPMRITVSGADISLFIPTVRPDPLQSAFYGRIGKNASGGVSIRGKFKLRPISCLLMGGLAGLALFISCGFAWGDPASLYVPVLTTAGLYGGYRLAIFLDGDNREELSSLLETAA